jgi:catechol 2,3-dioxygenase-like lactoylglutathione lyase family enzyme
MSLPSPLCWLSTYNGKEALISLPDVEYVNFLFEMERPITALLAGSIPDLDVRAKEDRQDGTVDLYFRGRPAPITLRVDNSEKLKEIFEELAGKQLSEVFSYVSFTDDEGQLIAFRPDRLTLLLAHRGSIQMTTEEEYEALFRPD